MSDTKTDGGLKIKSFRNGPAAVALRLAGASFTEIAEVLDLADATSARVMVESELAARSLDTAGRDVLRQEAAARLDRLLKSVWTKATTPTDPEHLPAVKVAHQRRHPFVNLGGGGRVNDDFGRGVQAVQANVIDVPALGPAPTP